MGNNFTPAWIKKGFFNESLFCDDFLSTHQLLYSNGAYYMVKLATWQSKGRLSTTLPPALIKKGFFNESDFL